MCMIYSNERKYKLTVCVTKMFDLLNGLSESPKVSPILDLKVSKELKECWHSHFTWFT